MSIELPPLITTSFGFNEVGEKIPSQCDAESVEAREHALFSRIAQLERMWREAEDRALCAEEAAMSHAARIIELEKKYEQAPS